MANIFFIVLTNKCNLNCKHCYAIHNNEKMTDELLQKSSEYIISQINNSDKEDFFVNYLGGEAGIYDQDLIINSINEIKKKCKKNIIFSYQSNLVFKITQKHLNVFKLVSTVNTSYDYGIRFQNDNQYNLWKDNINLLNNLGVNVSLTTVLTKPFIEYFNAKSFVEFIESLNIKTVEFNRLFRTLNGDLLSNIRAKNKDVNDWLYNLFIYTEKNNININFKNFKCLKDSFYNIHYNDYCRTCCNDNISILPNGNVITCMLDYNMPIFNLISHKKLNDLENVCKKERALNKKCQNCEYLQWCKGNCHHYIHDESDCPTPTKIYEYLNIIENTRG